MIGKLKLYQKFKQVGTNKFNLVNVMKFNGNNNPITMDSKDLDFIMDHLKKKIWKNKKSKYLVRGLSKVGWRTIKGYDSDYNRNDVENYWKGKTSAKFNVQFYSQIQIIIKA